MRWSRTLAIIWVCFAARLFFYAAMQPPWEGYDEWAHFSVIRLMACGHALVDRNAPVPADIDQSLDTWPRPWELRNLPPHSPRGLTAYEALQPPLYYWLATPLVWASRTWPLATQIMLVRFFSTLIASLIVPLVGYIVYDVFEDERVAVAAAAMTALMPGLAIDVARVGNDSLAVLIFTLLIWLGLRPAGWALGVTLGLGLLTKAYFLVAIPALLFFPRNWRWRALAPPLAIAGWWYARNLWTTGTLAGLSESVMLRDTTTHDLLQRVAHMPWLKAIDAILLSHIYFGGWSSLTIRSWMYHLFYLIIPLAAIGLLQFLWGRRPRLRGDVHVPTPAEGRVTSHETLLWLIAIYLAFWLAQLYNAFLIYASKGVPASMGWYLYAVIAAEVALCVAGRYWVAATGAVLFALLDLYTVHLIAIPYYTGVIAHKPTGALLAVHLADLGHAGFLHTFDRLAAFKPLGPEFLIALWVFYVAATVALLWTSLNARHEPNRWFDQKSK